jgi:hypothetical protein
VSIKHLKQRILTSVMAPVMTDFANEQMITFHELARRLPRRRGGRPTHVSTIHRWRQRGVSGVRLSAVRCGSIWLTTWEAYQRFVDAITSTVTKNAPSMDTLQSPLADLSSSTDQALDQLGL